VPEREFSVLFLCTGNSARSILAEALLSRLGAGRFRAHSAGSHPKGEPHPVALVELRRLGYDTAAFRSKSWDEFAGAGAPPIDLVITVCDDAAGEACPVWPGHPLTVHWSHEDPAAVVEGAEQRRAFREVYRQLEAKIRELTRLPLEALDRVALKERLEAIALDAPAREPAGKAPRPQPPG